MRVFKLKYMDWRLSRVTEAKGAGLETQVTSNFQIEFTVQDPPFPYTQQPK